MGQTQSSKLLHNKQLCSYAISIESQIDFCKYELKGGSCKVFKDKEDCSTQEDIFNYPQNDKSEAAENPLPHFSIMTIKSV